MEPARVTAVLREHVDPALEAVRVVRGAAGNSQETWLVTARGGDGEREFVLRRSAPAGVLEWTERSHEVAVLRALEGRGLPVPRVFGAGVLERPYVLMERLPGCVPGRTEPGEAQALARELGVSLARLHALDPQELGVEVQASAREATLREVESWTRRYHDRRAAPVPLLGALLAWAEHDVPDDGVAPVLLWGDAGVHNVLSDGGRITALLDWELWHVGHPLEDLGAAVWSCLDAFDPEDVVAGYEAEAGGVAREVLDYYVALGCMSRVVMIVNGVAAWVEGRATAPSTAGLGLELTALSLARGAAAAGWGALPAADGHPPRLPLEPDPAATLDGVARWLIEEVLPAAEDRRLRRMLKTAAALLETTAARVPEPAGHDLRAAEEAAVRSERAGGDASIREALLADLAREWERLQPLNALHGHGLPARRQESA